MFLPFPSHDNNARKPVYADVENAPKDLRDYIRTCNETAEKIEELKSKQLQQEQENAQKIAEQKEKEIVEKALEQKTTTTEEKK